MAVPKEEFNKEITQLKKEIAELKAQMSTLHKSIKGPWGQKEQWEQKEQKEQKEPGVLVLGEPVLGEPVLGEPVLGEPVLGEPVLGEPVPEPKEFLCESDWRTYDDDINSGTDSITVAEYIKYFNDKGNNLSKLFLERYVQYLIDPVKLIPGDVLRFYCNYHHSQSLQHHTLLVKESGAVQILKRPWHPEVYLEPKEFSSYQHWVVFMSTNPYVHGSPNQYENFINQHTLVNKKIARSVFGQVRQES